MRVVKMARTVRTKNALALQRSSFRENPTYFLTSVRRWVCELVFDAIYDWRSEFSHNRQNEKALKCKPSALIFGRGRAKELLHVLEHVTESIRKTTKAAKAETSSTLSALVV